MQDFLPLGFLRSVFSFSWRTPQGLGRWVLVSRRAMAMGSLNSLVDATGAVEEEVHATGAVEEEVHATGVVEEDL